MSQSSGRRTPNTQPQTPSSRPHTPNSRPQTPPDEKDEILYQSSALKERLLQSRCNAKNSTLDLKSSGYEENCMYDTESSSIPQGKSYEESLTFSDGEELDFEMDDSASSHQNNEKGTGKQSHHNRPITARFRKQNHPITDQREQTIDSAKRKIQDLMHKNYGSAVELEKQERSNRQTNHTCGNNNSSKFPMSNGGANSVSKYQNNQRTFLDQQSDIEVPLFQRVNSINVSLSVIF